MPLTLFNRVTLRCASCLAAWRAACMAIAQNFVLCASPINLVLFVVTITPYYGIGSTRGACNMQHKIAYMCH